MISAQFESGRESPSTSPHSPSRYSPFDHKPAAYQFRESIREL
jgi:hypothetical protein